MSNRLMKGGEIIEVRDRKCDVWMPKRFIGKVDGKFVCFDDEWSIINYNNEVEFGAYAWAAGRKIIK